MLAVFIALTLVGAAWLRPDTSGGRLLYGPYVSALMFTLVLVCYLKGEPPSFRWGRR